MASATASPTLTSEVAAPPPRVPTERVRVHSTYIDMLRFVEVVRSDPTADRWEVFQDEVIFPNRFFFSDYLLGSRQREAVWREWIEDTALSDIEGSVELLRQADLESTLEDAVDRISERLPLPSLEIFILLAPPSVVGRHVGLTIGPSKFALFLTDSPAYFREDETAEEIIAFWQSWAPSILAHEAHHSVRISRGAGGFTLADFLVLEGLADAFAEELYPNLVSSCNRILSAEQERLIWAEMQPLLFAAGDLLYQRYFQGAGGLDPCIGYHIGYQIVSSYLRNHPGVTAADLVTTPAREIVLASGYAP